MTEQNNSQRVPLWGRTARALAAQKGIGYQTYVKMLLHEALRRETGKQ